MRDNLSRGKRVDNGEWVCGYYAYCTDGCEFSHRIYIIPAETYGGEKLHSVWFEVIPETVGQYTGMAAYWTDFENEPQEEDVWEHDLLEVTYKGKKVIAKVEFEVGMFILCSNEFADGYIPLFDVVTLDGDDGIKAKKIGNIHDNPELLKGGAE